MRSKNIHLIHYLNTRLLPWGLGGGEEEGEDGAGVVGVLGAADAEVTVVAVDDFLTDP